MYNIGTINNDHAFQSIKVLCHRLSRNAPSKFNFYLSKGCLQKNALKLMTQNLQAMMCPQKNMVGCALRDVGSDVKARDQGRGYSVCNMFICVFAVLVEGFPCTQDTSPPLEVFCIELFPFIPPLVAAAWLLMTLNGLFSTLVFTC